MSSSDASLDEIAVPRSTGEVISDAVAGLRRSFSVLFALAVPFCAVDLFLREVASSFLTQVTAKVDPLHVDLAGLATAGPAFSAAVGFLVASFFVQTLLGGAVAAVADDLCWRRTPSVKRALTRLVERGAPLLLTAMLFGVLLMVACSVVAVVPVALAFAAAVASDFVGFLIPGFIVGVVLAFGVLIVLTLRWSLFTPCVVVEERSLWSALSRSSGLSAARGLPFFETPKFRLSVLLLVGLALSGVLQSLFLAPRLILAALTGWSFADWSLPGLAQMPVWFMVPFGLLEVVTNATVIPFTGLLVALFAFDLRVRYEGVTPTERA